jgi:sugar/nucleoside kinase (ribokinase family)
VANLGASQYEAGHLAWSSALSNITCFQLDLVEMRRFFRDPTIKARTILEWFRERCTVVITLDRMGAVAQLKNSEDIYFVWPYELPPDMIADTTGAGDAFAAGIAWSLAHKRRIPRQPKPWQEMLQRAALWAAYACCQQGGAMDCPSLESLNTFRKKNTGLAHGVDVLEPKMGERILRLIDRAFPP